MPNTNLYGHKGGFWYRQLMVQRHEKIKQAAYFKAEHRGFIPGFELQDWLEAEQEIDNVARPVIGAY